MLQIMVSQIIWCLTLGPDSRAGHGLGPCAPLCPFLQHARLSCLLWPVGIALCTSLQYLQDKAGRKASVSLYLLPAKATKAINNNGRLRQVSAVVGLLSGS